jgi:integrase/recombinase XerD
MKISQLIIKSHIYRDLLENFGIYLKQIGYSKMSQTNIYRNLKEFLNWLELQQIEEITAVSPSNIKAFSLYLQTRPSDRYKNEGISTSYQSAILNGIRNFYHYLLVNEQCTFNPFDSLYFPSPSNRKRHPLSRNEITQLYEACQNLRDKAYLSIYYGCGLRLSEGVALKVNDISFADGVLYVREGKGRRRRAVPMSGKVATDLLSYLQLERPKGSETAFILNRNKKVTKAWVGSHIKLLAEKAGLPSYYSLHYLRHSIATHLLENGLKVELVGDFLGHLCLESTKTYAKVILRNHIKNF